MLLVGAALKDYAVEARDGKIGSVTDLLFEDTTWQIRWLVVDTGTWLSPRKVLLHPSALDRINYEKQVLSFDLSKEQIEASPEIFEHQPVSEQMENSLYDYYGWDPAWGGSYFGSGAIASPFASPPYFGGSTVREAEGFGRDHKKGDRHLRSLSEVKGYHILASDGEIGHVENFLIDDVSWGIHYLIVDTSNWWVGQHVLVSPYAVRTIDWSESQVALDVDRAQVKSSPKWDPLTMIDADYQKRLHSHYRWPGYGW